MERPMSDAVARPARAYLAALVPPDEVSDAWHELVADATYWGDRELLPVLRLAHQVVLQHQRVAPEVAALALVDAGIEDASDVATVLGADEERAREWTHAALAARAEVDGHPEATATAGSATTPEPTRPDPARPAEAGPAPAGPAPAGADPRPDPGPELRPGPTTTTPAASTATAPSGPDALRIGFEDDGALPKLDGHDRPRVTTRRILLAAVALWVLVVLVWLLL